ncbi:hypothetical protein ABIB25_001751 [Nakamurella sp. UYEF19]|uniref:hypothetical protein n=1 Tax=Nakamurella sp. UYEF19 TaxID=1756392 RepID=UPI00339B5CAA
MKSWRDLPGPARAIGITVVAVVDAALDRDPAAFAAATGLLTALPAEQSGLLLGAVVRQLLEGGHVDGLDEDGIRQVLSRCYQAAASWLPPAEIDVAVLVAVLSGALGIHEPGVTYREIIGPATHGSAGGRAGVDDWIDPELPGGAVGSGRPSGTGGAALVPDTVPTTAQYCWHAALLIADLLPAGRRSLSVQLDRAFREIAGAETMEMP